MNKQSNDGGDETSGSHAREEEEIHRVLDEEADLLSPIPCASPSEEPQVDEVI